MTGRGERGAVGRGGAGASGAGVPALAAPAEAVPFGPGPGAHSLGWAAISSSKRAVSSGLALAAALKS